MDAMGREECAVGTGVSVCLLSGDRQQGKTAETLQEDLRSGLCAHLSEIRLPAVFGRRECRGYAGNVQDVPDPFEALPDGGCLWNRRDRDHVCGDRHGRPSSHHLHHTGRADPDQGERIR